MPRRIQMKRTKGWRKPANAVYVGRPTKWGNPFSLDEGRAVMVERYRAWLRDKLQAGELDLAELRGKDLACWCPLTEPCHADVLLEQARVGAAKRSTRSQ